MDLSEHRLNEEDGEEMRKKCQRDAVRERPKQGTET